MKPADTLLLEGDLLCCSEMCLNCLWSGEDRFSAEATSELEEMTRGVPLLAQVRPPFSVTFCNVEKLGITKLRVCFGGGFVLFFCWRSPAMITTQASRWSTCGTWLERRYDISLGSLPLFSCYLCTSNILINDSNPIPLRRKSLIILFLPLFPQHSLG